MAKVKIPQHGYLYLFKRLGSKPFEGTQFEIQVDGKIYDVMASHKSYVNGQISDIIINLDTLCFDKIQPGKELELADKIGKELGIQINQLLMG